MRPVLLIAVGLLVVGCMSWKSPINSNTLIAEDRVPTDGEIQYRGTINAFESVSSYMQSDGRIVRLNFDLSVRREAGKIWLQFNKADFNAYGTIKFQDLVRDNYVAESWKNHSFNTDFMRRPIDGQLVEALLRAQPEYSRSDERSLLEVIGLLLNFLALENLNPKAYAGNQALVSTQISLFGYSFSMASASTILAEKKGYFDLEIDTQLSASYFLKFPAKDKQLAKTNGVYYSIGGKDRSVGSYSTDTMLPKTLDLSFSLKGFQQAYFADDNKLYYLEPTRIQVHIRIDSFNRAS